MSRPDSLDDLMTAVNVHINKDRRDSKGRHTIEVTIRGSRIYTDFETLYGKLAPLTESIGMNFHLSLEDCDIIDKGSYPSSFSISEYCPSSLPSPRTSPIPALFEPSSPAPTPVYDYTASRPASSGSRAWYVDYETYPNTSYCHSEIIDCTPVRFGDVFFFFLRILLALAAAFLAFLVIGTSCVFGWG